MAFASLAIIPFIQWKVRFNRVIGFVFTGTYIIYIYTLGAA